MKRSSSEQKHFCSEPWSGSFSVETNGDVSFCPCYLKLKIGNLHEASMQDIWNCEELVALRTDFREGVLPELCRDQLCPVAVNAR
jgi:radical SAM protein with 4Fe4S-binding SPASM domain